MKQVFAVIKPNSKHREGVYVGEGGGTVVFTKAPAVEGKANEAAARLLAAHFRVSRSQVRLVRGHTSKYKVFEIDIDDEQRKKQLSEDIITIILPTINS